jgi:hypothetical protein
MAISPVNYGQRIICSSFNMSCFAWVYVPRGVKKGVSKQKFESTVKKIKRKGSAKNPYAVANAKLGRKTRSKTKSRK